MDICTICGREGHCAAACDSSMAGFIHQQSGIARVTAERPTAKSEKTESTPSTDASEDTSSLLLLAEYEDLVDQASDALGGKRAVSRWLGLNRGTVHYRLAHPHTIKREHVLALELLLERVNR